MESGNLIHSPSDETPPTHQRRWLLAIVNRLSLILFLLVLVFFLFSALPADPVRALLGVNATEEAVEALRGEFGLDRPLLVRFVDYLGGAIRLDFGRSYVTRRSVGPDVVSAYCATLTYVGGALTLSLLYSLFTAVVAYFGARPLRQFIQAVNSVFTSIPSLVVAVGFGVTFLVGDLFAFIEAASLRRTVMASVALAVYPACSLSQILIEELDQVRLTTYVVANRSFGFSELQLFVQPVIRNALLPWLAQLSNVAATLVAGSIVVEVVFSLAGLGRLVVQSVMRADLPMIQGIVLVTAGSFLLLDAFVELLYQRCFSARRS